MILKIIIALLFFLVLYIMIRIMLMDKPDELIKRTK